MKTKNREFSQISRAVKTALATLFLGAAANGSAIADDTEIFTAYTSTSPNSNVVFILDTSGSMSDPPRGEPNGSSKIQIVKDVFEKLIFDPENPSNHSTINPDTSGLNFALMRFDEGENNNSNGGYFITPMQPLNGDTKGPIWDQVNALTANGWTPLAETAYEATRYFLGDTEHFGNSSSPGTNVAGITDAGRYKTPFNSQLSESECAINNHLVILTDGMPTKDGDADSLINSLTGLSCSFSDTRGTDCLPQVAQYLNNTDFLPTTVDGVQNVKTHTIAFDLHQVNAVRLLEQTAQNGGGIFLSASNATQLSDAITEVIRNVATSAKSFVSPTVSISDANPFVHDGNLYFGMFEPTASTKWTGNLKGYQINEDGYLVDFSEPPIAALDDTGEIAANARSKWSVTVDGAEIGAGGAASRINLARISSIFTQNASNAVVSFNDTNVSQADLGAVDAAETTAIMNWARGRTDDGSALRANPIGDPLHSTPQVMNYGGSIGSVIFFGTNEGFLHAIDAQTGLEKFALIPRALLANLKTFKDDILGSERPYGLDGPITLYHKDANGNGQIVTGEHNSSGEYDEVILIVTMRRGGNQIFAFNVTDPEHPSLLWQITGGSGDFSALGQTWSKPIVTKLNIGNYNTPNQDDVVLFAGGYDEQYDDVTFSSAEPNSSIKGNAIYAVGLRDGVLKWSANGTNGGNVTASATSLQIPEMDEAIPSDVTYIDINSDGITDRIYVIDIVGRIFRIDFNITQTTGNTTQYVPTGQLFADLSSDNRRFYYAVDLVYTYVASAFKPMFHLNVGSGNRSNPLNLTSQDRFFSVRDEYVRTSLPSDFSVITLNDLTDTGTLTPTTTINKGWYFDLPQGEKVLSTAGTVLGYTFFTTYVPPLPPTGPTCTPPTGTGKLYAVKLYNSEALGEQRARTLQASGIPPSPAFMSLAQSGDQTPNTNNPLANRMTRWTVLAGTENPLTDEEQDKLNSGADAVKTYWAVPN
ncbi:MAG: hypothetical protein L0Z73_14685 [Gammaproteobacteria bacterium]|nr:hypothetical protein [Gammaproteobacteria bacterium]